MHEKRGEDAMERVNDANLLLGRLLMAALFLTGGSPKALQGYAGGMGTHRPRNSCWRVCAGIRNAFRNLGAGASTLRSDGHLPVPCLVALLFAKPLGLRSRALMRWSTRPVSRTACPGSPKTITGPSTHRHQSATAPAYGRRNGPSARSTVSTAATRFSTESRDRRPGRLRNGSGTGLAASLTSAAMFPLTPCP